MHELVYQVSFNTPAFLGNAEQQAQWRTPPFKALIRQWWRVVKAPSLDRPYDWRALRKEEGALFGAAADGQGDSQQSWVRLRLEHWDAGRLDKARWPRAEFDDKRINVGGRRISADLYLGFGPVPGTIQREKKPDRSALDPEKSSNVLSLRIDRRASQEQRTQIQAALSLCNWFGGVGSRSRNGWGSVVLMGDAMTRMPSAHDLAPYVRPFDQCFEHDWPHAIGADRDGPLVWTGRAVKNWREAVLALAQIRLGVRAVAKKFGRGQDISANQLIAYPVTKSGNNAWGNAERIASPMRLKVVKTPEGLAPLVVHLPSAVPEVLLKKLGAGDQRWIQDHQKEIWQTVHADLNQRMNRPGDSQ